MSVDIRSSDRRRYMNEIQAREKEIAAGLLKAGQPESPKLQESDKRHRREIANSNERRRMQCINAGFTSLRALIPQLEGEKLSKAAILQQTTEYITALEKDKRRLQLQVDHYTLLLSDMGTQGQQRTASTGTDGFVACTPPPSKRKKRITESSDEGVGALSDESDDGGQLSEQLRQENLSLNHQLDAERQRCQAMEEKNQMLERQLFSLLQSQQPAPMHTLEEMGPVKIESQSTPVHESLYNREVVEVIGSMRGMPTPPREDSSGQIYSHLPPRPMSPTPERGMAMELSSSMSNVTEVSTTPQSRSLIESRPASVHYDSLPLLRASLSLTAKGESISYPEETSAPGVTFQQVSVAPEPEKQVAITATTLQDDDQPMRTYQHRDHPRRRHRQQARLERQRAQQEEEEKLRRQEQEKERLYQERVLAPPLPPASHPQAFRPAQNLENLVEAIRHIEGEAALCDPVRLYEEEHKLYEKRQAPTNSSEESSSMSDPDELKSESSGRDSPLQHHHHQHHTYHQRHLQHPEHSTLSDHHLQLNNASSPSLSSLSISSLPSETEKASPVSVVSGSLSNYQSHATFLVHQSSSHPSSFYRPGVIVHKQ
ncbi:transcription factor AP-4-like [Elysia marginata]|uniref:Transcription factor AP-4-like n=1 Tax=Elysia marginata TaxID=1093978 RepID=A0AAV4EWQ1_9GAST|nr:transcription factor AP-4-like [Elysia marginata]